MASEPRDIEAFLRATAPFDRLDAEQIAPIARGDGAVFPGRRDDPGSGFAQ